MKLQTQIPLSPEKHAIDYGSKVLLMGSCFTEQIGEKLAYFKFQQLRNPFGIVFHPIAIEKLITRAINETVFTEDEVFENDGNWYCFEAHSSLTATSAADLVSLLNANLERLHGYLLEASHIILTLGTAWVYRLIDSDSIVANCHKIPQKKFIKELLTVEEISASLARIHVLLSDVNPSASLILTVSPIRHLKDGFVENGRSKAHLIAGVHDMVETYRGSYYFPSYELMMDELRDYRFYGEDMLHPTNTAIEYIWEKFNAVWIADETAALQKEIDSIQKGLQHRPFNSNSEKHQQFLQNLELKIERIKEKIPTIVF